MRVIIREAAYAPDTCLNREGQPVARMSEAKSGVAQTLTCRPRESGDPVTTRYCLLAQPAALASIYAAIGRMIPPASSIASRRIV
jgi:hypothetical protein